MSKTLQKLTQELIQAREVSDSLDLIEEVLQSKGFKTEKIPRRETVNLVASRKGPRDKMSLLFLGHADVVPAGIDEDEWSDEGWLYDPFGGEIHGKKIFGRGAVDMKGAIACFLSALDSAGSDLNITVVISGDEEGDGTDGTPFVLETLKRKKKDKWDFALIGEPTTLTSLGDHVKIGSRGSINVSLLMSGEGGHVAYPAHFINPIRGLTQFLDNLEEHPFGDNDPVFGKTQLEVTSILTDSDVCNVVPSEVKVCLNIRYTPQVSLKQIDDYMDKITPEFEGFSSATLMNLQSQPLKSPPSPYLDSLVQSIKTATKREPSLSATGASSDARFLPPGLPFAEFGLRVREAHKVNEFVTLEDLEHLRDLYIQILKDWEEK